MLVGYLLISKYLRKITYAARIRYLFLPTELTGNHHQYKSFFLERRKKYSYNEEGRMVEKRVCYRVGRQNP